MSVRSNSHYELTDGVGKCSELMWWRCDENYKGIERLTGDEYRAKVGDSPFADGGFCDAEAYGPKPGDPTGAPLLCPKHGGPKEIMPPC